MLLGALWDVQTRYGISGTDETTTNAKRCVHIARVSIQPLLRGTPGTAEYYCLNVPQCITSHSPIASIFNERVVILLQLAGLLCEAGCAIGMRPAFVVPVKEL